MVLHNDYTLDEDPVDKKVEVEARDLETGLVEVIVLPNPKDRYVTYLGGSEGRHICR